MKHLELHRFKKAIGAITFGLFFPNENKRLEQKHGVGKQVDLVLVTPGTQTQTAVYVRLFTGWTVKKSTAFVKEGDYPKVVTYNFKKDSLSIEDKLITEYFDSAKDKHNIIFDIY
jgi:hypothetical protein